MRLFVLAALCVGSASAAFAADLPPPMAPPPRAPATYAPAPIPFYNWTGFYVGGNLGWGFSSPSASDTLGLVRKQPLRAIGLMEQLCNSIRRGNQRA